MKNAMRIVSTVLLMGAGVALAQKTTPPPTMEQAKSMAMKERSDMMAKTKAMDAQVSEAMKTAKTIEGDKGKALDAQLAELQKQVKALSAQLATAPKYFDEPISKDRP
jgi:hypothetical protein